MNLYAGAHVEAVVGDTDPANRGAGGARERAVRRGDRLDAAYRVSHWLMLDLPARVERLGVPVTSRHGSTVRSSLETLMARRADMIELHVVPVEKPES